MNAAALTWHDVCALSDITPGTGVCALVADAHVAVFLLPDGETCYAISNHDPIGGASVLSRGLLTHLGGEWSVASPLYKQHYLLKTGSCVEDDTASVAVYPVRIQGEQIQVGTA